MPIYSGSETQEQDTRITASLTAAETPAYRGTALHVIEDFQLQDFGNRIPNMQYEVFSQGTTQAFRKVITLDNDVFSGLSTGGAHYANGVIYGSVINSGAIETYRILGDGSLVDFQTITPQAPVGSAGAGLSVTDGTISYNNGRYAYCIFASSPQYSAFFRNGDYLTGGIVGPDGVTPVVNSSQHFVVGDNYLYLIYDVSTGTRQGTYLSAYAKDGSTDPAFSFYLDDLGFTSAAQSAVRYDAVTKALYAINYDTTVGTMDVYSFDADSESQLLSWIGLTNNAKPGGDIRDSIFWYGDLDETASPGYTRTYLIQLNADQTFTELQSHDGQTVIDGGLDTDTGGADVRWLSSSLVVNGADLWTYSQPDASATTLQSVVEDLCSRAGMAATDYDASGLAGTNIDGYAIKGVQSLRQQLEPLMQVYEFEPYEDDYKLKFAFRGGAVILTVTEDDMRPHEYGSDGGEYIQVQHTEASKLPRRVNINYMNINADYEPDMQFFERSATQTVHVSDITFQMAFTPTFAVQLADKLLHEAWVSRTSYMFSLPKKYAYLTPTDVIVLNTSGFTAEVRLLEVGTGIDGRIQCKAVQSKILSLNAVPESYSCSALDSYILDIPDLWSYGVFADNKDSGELNSYDESGQGHAYQFGTDINTSVTWVADDTAPGACQDGLTVQKILNGSYGPLVFIPAADVPWNKTTLTGAAVIKIYQDTLFTYQPIVQVGEHRAAPDYSISYNAARNLTVLDSALVNIFPFPTSIVVPLNEWVFVHFQINVVSGDFVARMNDQVLTGTVIPDGTGAVPPYTTGAYVALTNGVDSGFGKGTTLRLGYAVDGADDGAAAYAKYLKSVPGYTPPADPYLSNATTEEPVVGQQVTPLPDSHVFFEVIDTNLLLASDTGLPVYVAGTSANFNGFQMQKSLDSGATWSDIGQFQDIEATMGVAQNALGSPHSHFTGRFDASDSMTVKFLTLAPSLESVTDLQAINGSNAFAVGAPGRWEIISAATITQQDPQTFVLSRLLRGMKGTEGNIGLMQKYDSVVLLSSASIGVMKFQTDDIGTTINLRAIYDAGFPDSDDDISLTITGNPFKEYAPAQIMGYWNSTGNIKISWNRRTRKSGAWRDSVDVPLHSFSSPESYTVKIYDNTVSPEILVRTITGNSTNSYTYSAAAMATDFGSPVPSPGQIRVEVYQVDTIVGLSRYGDAVI